MGSDLSLTAIMLCALEAQLRVFVEAHAPHFGKVLGVGGEYCEPVPTGCRGYLWKDASFFIIIVYGDFYQKITLFSRFKGF